MSKLSVAEASAPSSSISTQGSTPNTTSQPAANNSRGPELQGNTYTEKKPLTITEKIKAIQAAIQLSVDDDLRYWGSFDLSRLINYEQEDSIDLYQGSTFFRDLLLFVAKPSIAASFNEEVRNGLQIIKAHMQFYADLSQNDSFDEWCDYTFLDSGDFNFKDIGVVAKRYLSGDELEMVLSDAEKPKTAPRSLLMDPLTVEPEPCSLTDDQLVEALDRYFPGRQWPADKKAVATHERMKAHLVAQEKERLSILTETPEQKAKRLVNDAVYTAVNGPNIPARLSQIEKAVGVKPAAEPAKKPTSKPSTTKKKA